MKHRIITVTILVSIMVFLCGCNQNSTRPEKSTSETFSGAEATTDTPTNGVGSQESQASLSTVEKFFKNGPVCVQASNGLWGYIDINGNYVIEPKYQYASKFSSDGIAAVQDPNTGLYGYIDTSERYIIEPQYLVAYPFSQDLALVKDNYYSVKYINVSGQCVLEVPDCDDATSFSNGRAFVHNPAEIGTMGWAMIDLKGTRLTNSIVYYPTYEKGGTVYWNNDLCRIQVFNGSGIIYINDQGETIAPKDGGSFNNALYFSDGLASVQDSESMLWGYIDFNGEWAVSPQFADAQRFENGYALAKDQSGLYGIIDKGANWILFPAYEKMVSSYGNIIAYDGEGYKLIDMSGTVLKEYGFEAESQISLFSNVLRVGGYNAEQGGYVYQFYKLDGSLLIDASFSQVRSSSYSDSGLIYSLVEMGGLYGVIDGTGDWLIPANYLDIKL